MRKYQHFIFDYDGVLCNSLDIAIQGYNQIRANGFEELPIMQSKKDVELVYNGYLSTALNRWLTPAKADEFWERHIAFMQSSTERFSLFEGMTELIHALNDNQMSIVTSASERGVVKILSKAEIRHDKIFRIAGSERGTSKAERIEQIALDLKLQQEDVIYIGDLENDILYCKKLGIHIICVGYGYHSSEYLQTHQPEYLVNTVNELRDLISTIRH